MWVYQQSTGNLYRPDGDFFSSGYSGYGEGKNNPLLQDVVSVGPIPRGLWSIGGVYDSKRVGPHAIVLEPVGHNALGRKYFRMHGDSSRNPGKASKGCTIFPRAVREIVSASDDKRLMVIA